MRRFFPLILLLALAGCAKVAEIPPLPATAESTLYRFHLEHAGESRFSGLLALKPQGNAMLSVLLDATGIPLVKMKIRPDSSNDVQYRAPALRTSSLPELLGKVVKYIYFTPAQADCPWYALSAVCGDNELFKWKKFGPLKAWEVEQTAEEQRKKITVNLNLSSVTVHLLEMK